MTPFMDYFPIFGSLAIFSVISFNITLEMLKFTEYVYIRHFFTGFCTFFYN